MRQVAAFELAVQPCDPGRCGYEAERQSEGRSKQPTASGFNRLIPLCKTHGPSVKLPPRSHHVQRHSHGKRRSQVPNPKHRPRDLFLPSSQNRPRNRHQRRAEKLRRHALKARPRHTVHPLKSPQYTHLRARVFRAHTMRRLTQRARSHGEEPS